MEYSCVQLNDLPDEILLIIFQKLNNIEVLYSIEGVNHRLNKIIYDPIFTRHLSFVKWISFHFINQFCCNIMLERFCLQVLPNIHDKIKWLDVEASSMKHVLYATDYPNLHTLGLYNIDEDTIHCLSTDEIVSSNIFKNHIKTLYITINKKDDDDDDEMYSSVENIFDNILTIFNCLISLTIFESSYENCVRSMFFNSILSNFRSSTLLKLNIKVQSFLDCLYILDGRFDQLHTLYIDMVNMKTTEEKENKGDLLNLKCFSLSCAHNTAEYDNLILPLLYRMSNLEKLGLYVETYVTNTFIDGNYLKTNIINRMLKLNLFSFYIYSFTFMYSETNFFSTEDIQRTFIDFSNNEIISYVDYFPESKEYQCHIYSYPFLTVHYRHITNRFPGGLFNYVRFISLFDEYPFEHEFFLRIQMSFPFVEELCMKNLKAQNYKNFPRYRNLSIIKYSFLNVLGITNVHDDYIEQFLFDTKTYFQNNIILYIKYKSLERVTHYFTRDSMRNNCAKIKTLYLCGDDKRSDSLQQFFPNAKIID